MENEYSNPDLRREKMLEIIKEHGFSGVSYLSRLFNVSEMTIRRDMEKLESEERIVRVYGGAKHAQKSHYEEPLQNRLVNNHAEKMIIAQVAAGMVEDGDVIALDASSTAFEIAKHIKDKRDLTVVTNNISIAIELSGENDVEVVLLGGALRKKSLSLVGSSVRYTLESLNIDKAFLSSKALDITRGMTDATIDEGEAKKAMINASRQVIVVMDHTKIDSVAYYRVCGFDEIDAIIVDNFKFEPSGAECLKYYQDQGVAIHYAK